MIDRQECLKKIDAALSVGPKSADESLVYPIIKELRDHDEDSLGRLLEQEEERAEIDKKSLLLIKSIIERVYPEIKDSIMVVIDVRVVLRKLFGWHPLTMLKK